MEITFRTEKVYSEKLGREVILSCYNKEDDDKIIVSSKSLEAAFVEIKGEYGATIDNSDKPIISFDTQGNVMYAAKYVHLTDSDGYDAWEVGETTLKTRLGFIAENHPLAIAESRAKSKAIRRYLGLPLSFYSDSEVSVGDSSREETVSVLEKLGKKAAEKAAGVVEEAVTLEQEPTSEHEETAEAETTATPIVPSDEVIPFSDEPKPQKKTKKTAAAAIGSDLIVTFGPGKGKTVAEVIKDPACKVFVEKIRSGSVVIPLDNPEKAAIIKAIAAS